MTRRLSAVVCLRLSLAVTTFAVVQTASAQQAPASPPSSVSTTSTTTAGAPPEPAVVPGVMSGTVPGAASSGGATPASTSLDRIRAGVQRSTFLGGERAEDVVPTFRTEVTGHVIKLRNYWSDRDPDTEPDPFMYPIPSAAELLIGYGFLKPRAALRARSHRALKKRIQEEAAQVEQQRDTAAPTTPVTPPPAAPPAPPKPDGSDGAASARCEGADTGTGGRKRC